MLGKYTRREARELRARWMGQGSRIAAIKADIRSGGDWTKRLLADAAGHWTELPMLKSCPSRFRIPGEAAPRDLRGLLLAGDFAQSCGFADACLDLCVFDSLVLADASLRGTSLRDVRTLGECDLNSSHLESSDLRDACLSKASLISANLTGADLRGTDFRGSMLTGACLQTSRYTIEPWWGFLILPPWRHWTRFGGEFQSPNQLDSRTHPRIAKYVADENVRWYYTEHYPMLGFVRYLFSNCGFSSGRVVFWAVSIWLLFGLLFSGLPLPGFLAETRVGVALTAMAPEIDWSNSSTPPTWFAPFYFSMVTMTTVGYGDYTPTNAVAQLYCCIEAMAGYAILALLVAVLFQNGTGFLWPDGPSP